MTMKDWINQKNITIINVYKPKLKKNHSIEGKTDRFNGRNEKVHNDSYWYLCPLLLIIDRMTRQKHQ